VSVLQAYIVAGALAAGIVAGIVGAHYLGAGRADRAYAVDAEFKLQLMDGEIARMRAALIPLTCSGAWWCRSAWGHRQGCYGTEYDDMKAGGNGWTFTRITQGQVVDPPAFDFSSDLGTERDHWWTSWHPEGRDG